VSIHGFERWVKLTFDSKKVIASDQYDASISDFLVYSMFNLLWNPLLQVLVYPIKAYTPKKTLLATGLGGM
jgi:hypothetical protein